MPLVDFDSRWPGRDLVMHAYLTTSSTGDRTPPAAGLALGGPAAVARVDHGRWIADCPTPGCGGAEFVSLSGRHGFFCTECRNAATRHAPVQVVLPTPSMVGQVDAYLSARPVPANRNWRPDESVMELRAENRANGVRLSKEEG